MSNFNFNKKKNKLINTAAVVCLCEPVYTVVRIKGMNIFVA